MKNEVLAGVFLGLLLGIVGNILVTSMYRFIDKVSTSLISLNGLTFIVSFIATILIGVILYKKSF